MIEFDYRRESLRTGEIIFRPVAKVYLCRTDGEWVAKYLCRPLRQVPKQRDVLTNSNKDDMMPDGGEYVEDIENRTSRGDS